MNTHGFTLLHEQEVKELSSTARIFKHQKTGAELLSFTNTDENKVFGVSFRTPPADSTGVAHILEHSVLCGSKKYPVKEPFVELLKGSLQTFLNAFTYPDKTCYPVASANTADFRNLTDVYLDAVFFPVISENIFKQEGWHLEKNHADEGFCFKGVVYNEMKGAFSSPESVLGRYCLHSLFPDTVYGLESGGDPQVIPDLTYQAFYDFHASYYHPSNARFYFWGDDNEEERLAQLDGVLSQFTQIAVDSSIGLQKTFSTPRMEHVPFAASADDKGMVVVNWLGPDVMDIQAGLAFRILDHILLGLPASPLRRALIESGLGEDLTGGGLEDELRQLMFSVGLKGVAVEKASTIEELIVSTLQKLVDEGIGMDHIEAAINSIEFSLREKNTGSFPVGLAVMLNALTTWLHEGNPLSPLCFEEPLAAIKTAVGHGEKLFEKLISTWFLENTHRVTIVLEPDSSQAERMEKEEKARVEARVATLSDEEKSAIQTDAEQLLAWQAKADSAEALATIPRLKVSDLPLHNTSIPSLVETVQGVPVMFHGLPTSGIVYTQLAFDLSMVEDDEIPLLPLLGRALTEMGTKKSDFVSLNMNIAKKTGGIDASCLFLSPLSDETTLLKMIVDGKTTPDKVEELFTIMREIVTAPDLNQQERFMRMVLEEKARKEHSFIPAGHVVVAGRLRAGFDGAAALAEAANGVDGLIFLRELADEVANNWDNVLARLTQLHKKIFHRASLLINCTALDEQKKGLLDEIERLVSLLPKGEASVTRRVIPRLFPDGEALLVPAQVNYTGKAVNLYDAGYTWHGSAQVILKYLRTGYLWENVRVKGGAYGCMCGFDRASGGFYMVSYRDPSVLPTLSTYDATAEYLVQNAPDKAALDAAIVGAIGEIDAYLLPDAKGRAAFTRHLVGLTDDLRQQLREEVLQTSPADFKRFGEALKSLQHQGRVCVLGGSAAAQAADASGWVKKQLL